MPRADLMGSGSEQVSTSTGPQTTCPHNVVREDLCEPEVQYVWDTSRVVAAVKRYSRDTRTRRAV